jgi:uncharacterized DUF497 family protein
MAFSIRFNEEKNQLLKATRGISFEEIRDAIEAGDLLADIAHPSQKYSHQRMYAVRIKQYVYAIPYVKDVKNGEVFLKTAYPSRSLTRDYLKGGKHAKE